MNLKKTLFVALLGSSVLALPLMEPAFAKSMAAKKGNSAPAEKAKSQEADKDKALKDKLKAEEDAARAIQAARAREAKAAEKPADKPADKKAADKPADKTAKHK